MAQYLLELALLDSKMNMYLPSLLASAAIYVAMRVILSENQIRMGMKETIGTVWTKALQT
jgi:hypothetical protein